MSTESTVDEAVEPVEAEPEEVEGKASKKKDKEPKKTKSGKIYIPKFMKFLMVLYILNFALTLLNFVFTSRDLVTYDSTFFMDLVNMILEWVFIWFIWARYKIARHFGIIFALFNLVLGPVIDLTSGVTDTSAMIISACYDLMLLLYFIFSKKLKACLTEPFTFERDAERAETFNVKTKGWPFVREMLIFYCVFALLGHWMEAALCQLMRIGLIKGDYDPTNTLLWRDWFYPFPMEGLAVVLIAIVLYPLWRMLLKKFKNPIPAFVISFFCNMFLCVAIEFCMGLAVNQDLQLWDYSSMPFNFMGQICLQNSLGFGVAASIICWGVYPPLSKALMKVPTKVMNIVLIVVLAAYAVPQTLYLIDPPISGEAQLHEIIDNEGGYYTEKEVKAAQDKLAEIVAREKEHEEIQAEIDAEHREEAKEAEEKD